MYMIYMCFKYNVHDLHVLQVRIMYMIYMSFKNNVLDLHVLQV